MISIAVSMRAFGLDRLTPAERVRLAEELWDSIRADSDDLPLPDAQRADLQRRLDAYRDDPQASSDWETVEARLREQR